MDKYRKKPVIVHALQVTSDQLQPGSELLNLAEIVTIPDPLRAGLTIATLEGTMRAQIGDWIIRGVAGEYYPCKDAIFRATYEPIIEGEEPDGSVSGAPRNGS